MKRKIRLAFGLYNANQIFANDDLGDWTEHCRNNNP